MAITLLQAIHARWAANQPLCALLPAARVSTGLAARGGVPMAVITKETDQPLSACNDGSGVAVAGVRIQVFHGSYDAAAAVAAAARAVFDRADFDLDGGDRVIDMRQTNESQQQQDDGVWRIVMDFACTVHRTGNK